MLIILSAMPWSSKYGTSCSVVLPLPSMGITIALIVVAWNVDGECVQIFSLFICLLIRLLVTRWRVILERVVMKSRMISNVSRVN